MSTLVKQFGGNGVAITLTAGQRLAVASQGAFSVYQDGVYNNVPNQPTLLSASVAGSEYLSSVFASGGTVRVQADGGADLFYEQGTDAVVKQTRAEWNSQGTPGVLNATGALTSAMIFARIVTSTTAAAVAGTVPTGAVLDAASTWVTGEGWDWSVINTGGNTFTVTAASGHTLVGAAAVATLTTGRFRTVRTAASTFVTYRIG